MRTLIIIPAYNEEDSIVNTVREVIDAGYDYVVINDGSRDNTLNICKENEFNVLNLSENLGIGGAVQAGHKYAMHRGYDVDIQFDGDGQHDIGYVPVLLDEIEKGCDLVIGSRFLAEEKNGFQSTFMRRVGIAWISSLINVITGKKITDPTSGFRACSRKAIALFCSGYPVDYPEPESIVEALHKGLIVKEASVVMRERQGGSSSIKLFSSIYYMIKVTLAIVIMGVPKFQRRA